MRLHIYLAPVKPPKLEPENQIDCKLFHPAKKKPLQKRAENVFYYKYSNSYYYSDVEINSPNVACAPFTLIPLHSLLLFHGV